MTIRIGADAPFKACMGAVPGQTGDGAARATPRDAATGCIVAGDPAGRRIVLVHATSGEARAWTRLLRSVPMGQEWVAVARPDAGPGSGGMASGARGGDPGVLAAALRPLLTLRRGRKPLLVGCGTGVPVALRAALDFPDLIGGLLLVDPAAARPARSNVLRRIAARLMPPVPHDGDAELDTLAPRLGAIRLPVTLVQGKDEPPGHLGTAFLEQALTGCRTLTVVTVQGDHVLPGKHEPAVRGALAALIGAVERSGA